MLRANAGTEIGQGFLNAPWVDGDTVAPAYFCHSHVARRSETLSKQIRGVHANQNPLAGFLSMHH